MKKVLTAAAMLGLVGLATAVAPNATTKIDAGNEVETYAIDGSHTSVLFKVSHLGIVPFYGRFNTVSGSFSHDEGSDDFSTASLEVTVDVTSVDSNSAGRDRHLKSPDFFNTEQFPQATFKSTKIEAGEGEAVNVTGDLTIRGTTKEVSFVATPTGKGDRGQRGYRAGFECELVINRMDFGVAYMPDGLGQEVTLIIAVVGVRQ